MTRHTHTLRADSSPSGVAIRKPGERSRNCAASSARAPQGAAGAAGGVRLVVGELRTDVTKTRKDGSLGRLRYDYGDHRDPQAALAWLWKFIERR